MLTRSLLQNPPLRTAILGGGFNPYRLPDNAAIYDLSRLDSLIYDESNRLQLCGDSSGNSAVNCFASSGAASNTATTTTKSITGSQTITADVLFADYTPGTNHTLFSKLSGNDGIEALLLTTGVLRLRIGDGASITNVDSTAGVGVTDLVRATLALIWSDGVGATFTVNGAALGTAVAAVKTLTDAATTATIGTTAAGCIFRVQVGSVYDFNPSLASKLASSFSSGGDTWTVNTSGDTGARICGARDLVQMTQAKQPILTIGAQNFATFDGSNDYLKSAPFSLSQPTTVYFVGSQVTWTGGDALIDGNADSTGQLRQSAISPELRLNAGSEVATNGGYALNTRGLVTAIFNGAASFLKINKGVATTGSAGVAAMTGFTLGARGGGSAGFSNITASEIIIRSVADDATTQDRIAAFLMRKGGIA